MTEYALLRVLAKAFVTGDQSLPSIVDRAVRVLGKPRESVAPLAQRYITAFAGRTRPRHREVVRWMLSDPAWTQRRRHDGAQVRSAVKEWLLRPDQMQPAPAAARFSVPPIPTEAALADWLAVSLDELAWFADLKGLVRRDARQRLHHYHYRLVPKRSGGVRLIEAPQARLKALQRRILESILDHVPSFYTAAHGFVKGRSVRTFASQHVGRRVVLRMDLHNFFPRIGISRVQALFRTLGYPERVADLLGALCTNTTPRTVFASRAAPQFDDTVLMRARMLYARPHLPQGAPTSPALANLCAWRLDCRLTGLADWCGATYSRYADDLALSGDDEVARHVERLAAEVAAIALDEGWSVQHRKTRVMRQGVRQQLAGLVVNARVNVPRPEFDALKATLTNCVRHGAPSQNRDGIPDYRAHLRGRVAWVMSVNVRKGIRLQELFDQIVWAAPMSDDR